MSRENGAMTTKVIPLNIEQTSQSCEFALLSFQEQFSTSRSEETVFSGINVCISRSCDWTSHFCQPGKRQYLFLASSAFWSDLFRSIHCDFDYPTKIDYSMDFQLPPSSTSLTRKSSLPRSVVLTLKCWSDKTSVIAVFIKTPSQVVTGNILKFWL